MNWLLQHWQTIVALSIVGATAGLFALRWLRTSRQTGCGGGCQCEARALAGQAAGSETDPPPPSGRA